MWSFTLWVYFQAFLLKNILFNRETINWRQISGNLSKTVDVAVSYKL